MEGELGGFTAGRQQQEQANRRSPARPQRNAQHVGKVHGANHGEHRHHRQQQPQVTHAVHDESLVGGQGIVVNLVPETNQQVGRQTDAFPTDERHQVGTAQHQGQHGGHKEIQVGKETASVGVSRHVSHRIDVNEAADKRHQHHKRDGQRVQQQTKVHVHFRTGQPVPHRQGLRPVFRGASQHLCQNDHTNDEGGPRRQHPQVVSPGIHAAPRDEQEHGTDERNGNHQPGVLSHAGGGPEFQNRAASQPVDKIESLQHVFLSPLTVQQVEVVEGGGAPGAEQRHD